MKERISQYLVTIFFLIIIFSFCIWSIVDNDRERSVMEGRALEVRPDLNMTTAISGTYFKDFEKYYNDTFPLRTNWIEANSYLTSRLLRQDYINNVYISNTGYLITPVNTQINEEALLNINKKINDFSKYLKSKGIPLYFSLVPNKTVMMEDQIPNYIGSYGNLLSDKLISGFSDDLTVLDLREEISHHMEEENMYFYSDHHWKPKAAYYAYVEIIESMNKSIANIEAPVNQSIYSWMEFDEPFFGSEGRKVTRLNVSKPDTITVLSKKIKEEPLEVCYRKKCDQPLFNENILNDKDIYTNRYGSYLSGDVPEGIIKNPNVHNGQRILILKDSYANAMVQFFTNHFEETRLLDLRHYKHMSVKEYIQKNEIDVVLFVHNINSIITTPAFLNL